MKKLTDLSSRLSADPNARAKIIFQTYPTGYRLHKHSFFEFSFAIRGECVQTINGEPSPFRAGDISLITPAVLHEFIPIDGAEPLTMYTLSFTPDPIRPEFWAHIPAQSLPINATLDEETFSAMRRTFEKLHKRAEREKLLFDLFTQTAIEWIILNLIELPSMTHTLDYMKIRPALIYLQNNFSDPITLAEVASVAYFSREYFSGLFRRTMGISFQDYLLRLRYDYAADLLSLTDLTVSEIAEQSGFRTLSYFIRVFTRLSGSSPSQFRKRKKIELQEQRTNYLSMQGHKSKKHRDIS